jgi:hypothetical protein
MICWRSFDIRSEARIWFCQFVASTICETAERIARHEARRKRKREQARRRREAKREEEHAQISDEQRVQIWLERGYGARV